MAIVGGTVSELGGGKFSNGAMGSAFQYLFNDMAYKITKGQQALNKLSASLAKRRKFFEANPHYGDEKLKAFWSVATAPLAIAKAPQALQMGLNYALRNPARTLYYGEVVNEILNPSTPPITPHGAGVNMAREIYNGITE